MTCAVAQLPAARPRWSDFEFRDADFPIAMRSEPVIQLDNDTVLRQEVGADGSSVVEVDCISEAPQAQHAEVADVLQERYLAKCARIVKKKSRRKASRRHEEAAEGTRDTALQLPTADPEELHTVPGACIPAIPDPGDLQLGICACNSQCYHPMEPGYAPYCLYCSPCNRLPTGGCCCPCAMCYPDSDTETAGVWTHAPWWTSETIGQFMVAEALQFHTCSLAAAAKPTPKCISSTETILVAAFTQALAMSSAGVLNNGDVRDGIYIESKPLSHSAGIPCFFTAVGYCTDLLPAALMRTLAPDAASSCVMASGIRKSACKLKSFIPHGVFLFHDRIGMVLHFRPDGSVAQHSYGEGLWLMVSLPGAAALLYQPYHYYPLRKVISLAVPPLESFCEWLPAHTDAAGAPYSGPPILGWAPRGQAPERLVESPFQNQHIPAMKRLWDWIDSEYDVDSIWGPAAQMVLWQAAIRSHGDLPIGCGLTPFQHPTCEFRKLSHVILN